MEESAPPASVLAFDAFELDRSRFELRRDGVRVHMEPQVFEVLAWLVSHHDRLVTKQELLDHVWPESYISEAALNSRLMAARKAIGDNGREQRLIKTVHGRGFRFVGQVTVAPARDVVVRIPAPSQRPALREASTVIGRERELERLSDLHANPACRLLTIAGPGGVGKTRLLDEFVRRRRLAGETITSVSLESAEDASELPWIIAAGLGRHLQRDGSINELVERIGDQPCIVAIDNFEHLLPAGASIVADLLAAAPSVRLLITSRAVLGLRDEWLFALGGLSLEAPAGERPGAVDLFIARLAHDAQESLAVDEAEILSICRLVDGMPLAIELAAGLSRYLSIGEIRDSIVRDISVLRTGLRDIPERHRSIPGLLEESLRQLNVHQIGALLGCSIFEGAFSVDAARHVTDTGLPMLGALADMSLVHARAGRFTMHPLLRQFVRGRLDGAETRLRERHATYYAQFMTSRHADLESGRQVEACNEIDGELTNVLAAWRWAAEHRQFGILEVAARPLILFLQFRTRYHEANEATAAALAALEGETGHDALRLFLLAGRTWSCIRGGPHSEVPSLARRAVDLHRANPSALRPGLLTDPRAARAMLLQVAGQYERAYDLASEICDDARARGDHLNEASALWLAASAALRASQFAWEPGSPAGRFVSIEGPFTSELAASLLRRAVALLEPAGELWLRAHIEIELGLVAQGSNTGAHFEHFERACEIREAFNDRDGLAAATIYLADAFRDAGNTDRARELQDLAAEQLEGMGEAALNVEVSRSRGLLAGKLGDRETALDHLADSLQGSLTLGFVNNVLGNLRGVAEVVADIDPGLAGSLAGLVAKHPGTFPYTRAQAAALAKQIGPVPLLFDSSTPLAEITRVALERARRAVRAAP